jgi:ferredoxin
MSAKSWTVTVDRDLCTSYGVCTLYAAGTFTHDDDAKAVVIDPSTDTLDAVRAAAGGCPTGAITIHEGA